MLTFTNELRYIYLFPFMAALILPRHFMLLTRLSQIQSMTLKNKAHPAVNFFLKLQNVLFDFSEKPDYFGFLKT